jgi:hypothetical protein
MKFKMPHYKTQLYASSPRLIMVAEYFDKISQSLGIESVVTRVWDKVPGESGVHPAKRAIDFRNQHGSAKEFYWLYNEEQVREILNAMNTRFPRTDGRRTCIHHGFDGGPAHFHLQIGIKDEGWKQT